MRKSKHRTTAGSGGSGGHTAATVPDDKKHEDSDRADRLSQQQQQQQHSDSGLVATENTPTALRLKAQYSQGEPRPIPNSLRTGSDAIAAAAAVDMFYTTPFLQIAYREATELEIAARLRSSMKKVSSKLHLVRVEGLQEATAQLAQWTAQASIESVERQQHQKQKRRDAQQMSGLATAAPTGQPNVVIPPYDSVRVELLGSSSPAIARGYFNNEPQCCASPSEWQRRRSTEATTCRANALRSPSWDVVQRALEGVDYTNCIFNTILVPRLEVRNAMCTGAPISVQLPSDVALQWTTLPPTSLITAGAGSGVTPQKISSHENTLAKAATAVTYEEQELALRYIQGACLLLYHQRRCCSEGCLLYYATEVFQCMRIHVDALFTSQRQELEGEEQDRQRTIRDLNTSSRSNVSGAGPGTARMTGACRESGRFQVSVDPSLVRVVVALTDAVEAACHYNPSSLRRLVQTGGVTAMLNLAYCPFMPTPIRAAVLSTISVLLQQVTPLRRYVAAASKAQESNGPGGAVNPHPDPLLQCMLENAVHDNVLGGDGQPIPYSTDFGSASKFDSAVRNWFFANGLGNVMASVAQLQDLRSTFQSTSFVVPQAASVSTTVTHANMLREGELLRKRIGRLLECMDGRELR